MLDALRTLADVCVAMVVGAFVLTTLPLLTLGTAALYRLQHSNTSSSRRRKDGSSGGSNNDDDDESAERDGEESASGERVELFVFKGMVLWMALVQLESAVGTAAAAWLTALSLERFAPGDKSVKLLLEPPPKALDYVYLLGVAPMLSAAPGGVHGFAAGWQVFLCAAYFWRSIKASTTTALSSSVALYVFSYSFGVFGWRRWVRALGLEPAPIEGGADALQLVAAIGMLLLVGPGQTRLSMMVGALVLSDELRTNALRVSAALASQAVIVLQVATRLASAALGVVFEGGLAAVASAARNAVAAAAGGLGGGSFRSGGSDDAGGGVVGGGPPAGELTLDLLGKGEL